MLQHHIVAGRLPADEVLAAESLETPAGTSLEATTDWLCDSSAFSRQHRNLKPNCFR